MLTIQQIIDQVDTLVPNPFDVAKKVTWLNELNHEFFEVVRIPAIHNFTTTLRRDYPLDAKIKSNKVASVRVGTTTYQSMQYEDVPPGHNYWIINDLNELWLYPGEVLVGKVGVVKYWKAVTSVFTTGALTVNPDAPPEYHWSYVLGLCERVAKAMNDVSLANNYGHDYRTHLSIAQQNYLPQREKGE